MKFLAVFAVLAFLSTAAYAGIQPKSLLTDIIRAIIKNNRQKLADLELNIDLKEHGRLNVTLTNAENFELVQLEAPGPLSLKISNATITLDVAGLNGLYELINVNIPEIDATLNGQGQISAQIEGAWVTVALDCAIKGLTFEIKDFHDLAADVRAITGLVLEGIDADVVNKLAGYIPTFVQSRLPDLALANKEIILEKINEILAGLTY